jgi:hypothetical protein
MNKITFAVIMAIFVVIGIAEIFGPSNNPSYYETLGLIVVVILLGAVFYGLKKSRANLKAKMRKQKGQS